MNDLAFPRGEGCDVISACSGIGIQIAIEYHARDAWSQKGLVLCQGLDGGDEMAFGVALENEAPRPRPERLVSQSLRAVHREDEDFDVRSIAANLAGRIEPVQFRQTEVHHHHIRMEVTHLLNRLATVHRLAADFPIRPGSKHRSEAFAYEFVIVNEQDADDFHDSAGSGTMTQTVVPRREASISSVPPTSSRRSRIPGIPMPGLV